DLYRNDTAIAVDRIAGVVAVGEAAPAPADDLDIVAREILARVPIDSAKDELAVGAAFGRHRILRQNLREPPDDRAGNARMGLVVAADLGCGIVHVHHRAGRRDDADRPEAAGVLGD